MSSLSVLLDKVEPSLPHPTPTQRALLGKLNDVQKRIEEGRLRVAVLGQFKRGKSTLLNALLGVPLLPTGVTPVTAIPTVIKAGNTPSVLRSPHVLLPTPFESILATRPLTLNLAVVRNSDCQRSFLCTDCIGSG
jgi:hypothetical protein